MFSSTDQSQGHNYEYMFLVNYLGAHHGSSFLQNISFLSIDVFFMNQQTSMVHKNYRPIQSQKKYIGVRFYWSNGIYI